MKNQITLSKGGQGIEILDQAVSESNFYGIYELRFVLPDKVSPSTPPFLLRFKRFLGDKNSSQESGLKLVSML